jgi:NAD(P)H-dependent FMN reductase
VKPLIAVVSSSFATQSRSRIGALACAESLRALGCEVDFIDLSTLNDLPPYPRGEHGAALNALCERFNAAQGWVLATPIYNFGVNGALTTFLHYALSGADDERWKPFCILASMGGLRGAISADSLMRSIMLERNAVAVGPVIVGLGDANLNRKTGEVSQDMRERIDRQMHALLHYAVAWSALRDSLEENGSGKLSGWET